MRPGANGDPGRPAVDGFGLSRDPWGRLVLIDAQGRRHVGVEPIRAFPIHDPDRWISLCDAEGREIACVEDLAELAPPVRLLLQEELAQRAFMPIIQEIAHVSSDSAPSDWDVETDRGPTRFTLNSDDDIRRVPPHGVLIADAQGIRYFIPDHRALDAHGRRLLDRYL